MKRYASHYLCYREETLTEEMLRIIRRDQRQLRPIPELVLSSHPKGTKGFCYCGVELGDDGKLLQLFPFTEETESTEWHPGLLELTDLLGD